MASELPPDASGTDSRPLILGIGGSGREGSSSIMALELALAGCERAGARVETANVAVMDIPVFNPETAERTPDTQRFINLVRRADGFVICSPGYHGGPSGLIKNACDYLEDLRDDERPYMEGRAVGLVVTAAGWQAAVTTLVALRSMVHAFRAWPTPLGIPVNSATESLAAEGPFANPGLQARFDILGEQVVRFARVWR